MKILRWWRDKNGQPLDQEPISAPEAKAEGCEIVEVVVDHLYPAQFTPEFDFVAAIISSGSASLVHPPQNGNRMTLSVSCRFLYP